MAVHVLHCAAVCCSVVQGGAVRRSVLSAMQCVAVRWRNSAKDTPYVREVEWLVLVP